MANIVYSQSKTNYLQANSIETLTDHQYTTATVGSSNQKLRLEPLFPKATQLSLNTGNIVSANRLKRKANFILNDELIESLNSIFNNWLPTLDEQHVSELQEQKHVICRDPEYYEKFDASERDEVSISVKLFLNTFDPIALENALNQILEELNVSHIETLVLSFPDAIFNRSILDKNVIKPLWTLIIEKNLEEKIILSAGVSDLNKSYLEQLCNLIENKEHLPTLNQVNLASCCKMPEELIDYAKSVNIQLTTHNDPIDILKTDGLQSCIRAHAHEYDAYGWSPVWTARYTFILKGRGIVKSKGYIVNARRELRYTK